MGRIKLLKESPKLLKEILQETDELLQEPVEKGLKKRLSDVDVIGGEASKFEKVQKTPETIDVESSRPIRDLSTESSRNPSEVKNFYSDTPPKHRPSTPATPANLKETLASSDASKFAVPASIGTLVGLDSSRGDSSVEEITPSLTPKEEESAEKALAKHLLKPKKKETRIIPPTTKGTQAEPDITPDEEATLTPQEQMEKKRESLQSYKQDLLKLHRDLKGSREWAQVAEQFAHALTSYAAAREGLRKNVDMSGIQFQKTDWGAKMKQDLAELEMLLADVQKDEARIDRREEGFRREEFTTSERQARESFQKEQAQKDRDLRVALAAQSRNDSIFRKNLLDEEKKENRARMIAAQAKNGVTHSRQMQNEAAPLIKGYLAVVDDELGATFNTDEDKVMESLNKSTQILSALDKFGLEEKAVREIQKDVDGENFKQAKKKIIDLQTRLNKTYLKPSTHADEEFKTFNIVKKQMKGVENTPDSSPVETRTVDGVTYKKVPGGWEEM